MADIDFNCPHCGQNLNGPEEMAGESIDCPVCNKSFEIPGGIIEESDGPHQRTEACGTGPRCPAPGSGSGRISPGPGSRRTGSRSRSGSSRAAGHR